MCHNPTNSLSAVRIEQARSFKLLIQVELWHRYLRMEVLAPLYVRVADFMAEEEGLDWSVFCESGLLGSIIEMVVLRVLSVCCFDLISTVLCSCCFSFSPTL